MLGAYSLAMHFPSGPAGVVWHFIAPFLALAPECERGGLSTLREPVEGLRHRADGRSWSLPNDLLPWQTLSGALDGLSADS